jgi:glycosyltransferase involved in cell wall biosynthesis
MNLLTAVTRVASRIESFVKKINRLADSLLLRQEMGEYNRAKIEKYFTLDRMVQQYKDLFEKSLDRNNL